MLVNLTLVSLTSSFNIFQMTTEYRFLMLHFLCHDLWLCRFHINNLFSIYSHMIYKLSDYPHSKTRVHLHFNVNVFSFKYYLLFYGSIALILIAIVMSFSLLIEFFCLSYVFILFMLTFSYARYYMYMGLCAHIINIFFLLTRQ